MSFKETYISKTDKENNPTSKKKVISDDAFAIGVMLDEINFRLSRLG
jgi:hypothetical protein